MHLNFNFPACTPFMVRWVFIWRSRGLQILIGMTMNFPMWHTTWSCCSCILIIHCWSSSLFKQIFIWIHLPMMMRMRNGNITSLCNQLRTPLLGGVPSWTLVSLWRAPWWLMYGWCLSLKVKHLIHEVLDLFWFSCMVMRRIPMVVKSWTLISKQRFGCISHLSVTFSSIYLARIAIIWFRN